MSQIIQDLVLDVWREVGRHLDVPDVMRRVAPLIRTALPFSLLALRRVDEVTGSVETVGSATADGRRPAHRTETKRARHLAAWCRAGRAMSGAAAIHDAGIEDLLPEPSSVEGACLVPLRPDSESKDDEVTPPGVLVAVLHGSAIGPEERRLLEGLADPFAAALANDTRIREMKVLREAVEAENRALVSRFGQPGKGDVIVGAQAGLRSVLDRVEQVSRSDAPVLILGETGTGKEVIARAIHSRSPRSAGPMIRVNCGAIPPDLVDSELFGHERGSFTGATSTRQGWFERADGGTLFLDEIGELPLAAQVRLLRILQDGTFERVGGHASLTVHVRLVAATHRDLPRMVREGTFREDLWYRICVFPIHLPALRERPEDIPALATHFALRAARRLGLAPAFPTPEDLDRLRAYPWPGNVRELISVVERAAILGDGRRLEVRQALGTGSGPKPMAAMPAPAEEAGPGKAAPASLDAAVKSHIEAALRESLGRIDGPFGAARRLAVNPHTLRSRMRKLAIDWRQFR